MQVSAGLLDELQVAMGAQVVEMNDGRVEVWDPFGKIL